MVILRIWNSAKHGGGGWGHSSLEIGGTPPAGVYVSRWPDARAIRAGQEAKNRLATS